MITLVSLVLKNFLLLSLLFLQFHLLESLILIVDLLDFKGILHISLPPLPLFLLFFLDCSFCLHLQQLSLFHFVLVLLDVVLLDLFVLLPNIFLKLFQFLLLFLFLSLFFFVVFPHLFQSFLLIKLIPPFLYIFYVLLDFYLLFPSLEGVRK